MSDLPPPEPRLRPKEKTPIIHGADLVSPSVLPSLLHDGHHEVKAGAATSSSSSSSTTTTSLVYTPKESTRKSINRTGATWEQYFDGAEDIKIASNVPPHRRAMHIT
jgi:hypothetical protein